MRADLDDLVDDRRTIFPSAHCRIQHRKTTVEAPKAIHYRPLLFQNTRAHDIMHNQLHACKLALFAAIRQLTQSANDDVKVDFDAIGSVDFEDSPRGMLIIQNPRHDP